MSIHRLLKQAVTLSSPDDYYRGLGGKTHYPPVNILIFFRDSFSEGGLGLDTNFHYRHVLVFNCGERIRIMVDGSLRTVGSSEFTLLFPHQYHRFLNDGQQELSVLITTFEIEDDMPLQGLKDLSIPAGEKRTEELERAVCLFRDKKGSELTHWLSYILMKLLQDLERFSDLPPTGGKSPLVSEICRNLYRDRFLSIEGLSSLMGYSESYLRRRFKEKMEITLGRFILESRLSEAMKYLSTTDKSITEIAGLAGYDSIYSLSRSFRRETGLSPSQYRIKQSRRRKRD